MERKTGQQSRWRLSHVVLAMEASNHSSSSIYYLHKFISQPAPIFFYSTTVTMVKVHETGMVSLFYFIYSNIGYFNDTLTTGLEMSSVFFSEFWSP